MVIVAGAANQALSEGEVIDIKGGCAITDVIFRKSIHAMIIMALLKDVIGFFILSGLIMNK
jgi:hypothetical protein